MTNFPLDVLNIADTRANPDNLVDACGHEKGLWVKNIYMKLYLLPIVSKTFIN